MRLAFRGPKDEAFAKGIAMARHLDLIQRYGATNGYCHLWAVAIKEVIPEGRIMTLLAKDARTFRKWDWPENERLELHQFVLLPDGRAVDGEGVHDLDAMLDKFGIKRGYAYEIQNYPAEKQDLAFLDVEKPAWAEAIRLYRDVLLSLGWADGAPDYDGELGKRWKEVQAEAMKNGVPDPEPPALAPAP